MKITLDLDILQQDIQQEAGKIFINYEGEKLLIGLLELQEQVENALKEAKEVLVKAGSEINPNFTSIQGDRVKVAYRSYGQRFYIDEAHVDLAPTELYTKEQKISYKVDSKAVEKWIDMNGGMPAGINEVDRPKTLSITLKKNAKTEE